MGLTMLNLSGRAETAEEVRSSMHERAGMTLLTLADARAAQDLRARDERQATEDLRLAKESIDPSLFSLTAADGENPNFRRLTSPATLRDLNPLMHERMQQVCFYIKVTTPFGKRIVEIITDYVVGEGFKVVAEDDAVRAVLENYWTDPINQMDAAIGEWCTELTTFGELCIPVTVNPVNGIVRQGYLDPMKIAAIEYGVLSTGRQDGSEVQVSVPINVVLKKETNQDTEKRLRIVRRDEDVNSPTYGFLTGECFFFSINKAKSASRGISDLFCLADWVDVFDQMMFDFADRVRFLSTFVWDYTLKGADKKGVDDFRKEVTKRPPRQGGVQVHNEQVEIKASTPSLGGSDMSNAATVVKSYGLGGAGLPMHWFSDPVDANRATAQEMEGPTGKKLTNRQNHLKRCVGEILSFVIDQAIIHGVLSQGLDTAHSLQVPDLLIKDLQRASMTLGAVSTALINAQQQGWVRGETAARSFHIVLSQLGIEVDSMEEYELAQIEMQDAAAKAIDQIDSQKNLAAALGAAKQKELQAEKDAADMVAA